MLKYVHCHNKEWGYWGTFKDQFTLCYRINGEFVEFSVACCSKKDQYNKKKGRMIATKRMQNLAFWVLPKMKAERTTVQCLIQLIEQNPKVFAKNCNLIDEV